MSKFVVVTDKVSPQQQDAITSFFKGQGWEFWHWYENLWLLSDVPPPWTSYSINTEMEKDKKIYGMNMIVMQISEPISYWGRAPQESWGWMLGKWGKPAL